VHGWGSMIFYNKIERGLSARALRLKGPNSDSELEMGVPIELFERLLCSIISPGWCHITDES
jgi:hypothetical protein